MPGEFRQAWDPAISAASQRYRDFVGLVRALSPDGPLAEFEKGIFVGVGGSLDVLSGIKARAPEFFINHNLEWLYRIAKEPQRIKRFYNNNVKFMFKILKLK